MYLRLEWEKTWNGRVEEFCSLKNIECNSFYSWLGGVSDGRIDGMIRCLREEEKIPPRIISYILPISSVSAKTKYRKSKGVSLFVLIDTLHLGEHEQSLLSLSCLYPNRMHVFCVGSRSPTHGQQGWFSSVHHPEIENIDTSLTFYTCATMIANFSDTSTPLCIIFDVTKSVDFANLLTTAGGNCTACLSERSFIKFATEHLSSIEDALFTPRILSMSPKVKYQVRRRF